MAASIFKDDVICLSGTFPGYKHNDLKTVVKDGGGTFSQRVTATCTHLVTTQDDVDGGAPKYKSAAALQNIKLINVDWLLDSSSGKKRVNESAYLITPSAAPPAAAAAAAAPASPPPASPPKTRPSRTKRALDSQTNGSTASDAKDGPPAKKQKDDSGKSSAKNEDAAAAKQKTPEKKEPKINVPVDSDMIASEGYQVYIDNDGEIYDAALNQTNASNNNNKFYLIQLLVKNSGTSTSYITWARWGRVGEKGQISKTNSGNFQDAKRLFTKKFREKSGLAWEKRYDGPKPGKYAFVERNYEEDEEEDKPKKTPKKQKKDGEVKGEEDEEEEEPVESTLSKPVQDVVSLIFNQHHWHSTMASLDYDANKLPLGKLGNNTLQRGFELLKELSEVINDPSLASSRHNSAFNHVVEDLSNQYFSVIPHAFGRRRPPVISNEQLIKREVELLEALTDMEIANEIMTAAKSSSAKERVHRLDQQYMGLGLNQMTPLEHKSTEFEELEKYLVRSHAVTHRIKYKLLDVFRIERQGEVARFNSSYGNVKNTNRRLLWHGSRTTNYGGILSQGLRIAPPSAPVSGYAFGKGVYFADMSSKSANYCCSHMSNNLGLLMLCDVELGDPMLELDSGDYSAGDQAKKQGSLATWGKGRTTHSNWKDAGCVHPDLKGVKMPDTEQMPSDSDANGYLMYNEFIVYDVAQIQIKYLLLVHMN